MKGYELFLLEDGKLILCQRYRQLPSVIRFLKASARVGKQVYVRHDGKWYQYSPSSSSRFGYWFDSGNYQIVGG